MPRPRRFYNAPIVRHGCIRIQIRCNFSGITNIFLGHTNSGDFQENDLRTTAFLLAPLRFSSVNFYRGDAKHTLASRWVFAENVLKFNSLSFVVEGTRRHKSIIQFVLLRVCMFLMVMLMVMLTMIHLSFAWINNLEVCHHTCLMMFKNVAMVHPHPRPVIGHPGDFNFRPWRQVDSIFP